MNDESSHIENEIVYEGSLVSVLWYLLVSIGSKHLGGLVVFTAFLLITGQPWALSLVAFVCFVAFGFLTELVFHSHRGD